MLSESSRNWNYDYARGMKMVYFSGLVNRAGGPYAAAVHPVHGMRLLKDGYCMVMNNGRHWRQSIKMSHHEGDVGWVAKRSTYALCISG